MCPLSTINSSTGHTQGCSRPAWTGKKGCALTPCTHSVKHPGKGRGTNASTHAKQHTSSKQALITIARPATVRIHADMPAGTLEPSAYCTCLGRHACSHPGVLRPRMLPPLLQLPMTFLASAQQPASANCRPSPQVCLICCET